MSSDPTTLPPKTAPIRALMVAVLAGGLMMVAAPLGAQDDRAVTEADNDDAAEGEAPAPPPAPPPVRREFSGINLTVTVPKNESDQLIEEDCEREAEAGRVAGEIVVCRRLGEASDGSWNKEEWQRRYAEETALRGAPRAPDFILDCKDQGMPFGCVSVGSVPEAAIMIDVEALPQAPAGSDADRIARGLPPLGRDGEPSAEEIAARRRALGLDAPPIPE